MNVFDCCACVWHRVIKMQPSSKTRVLRFCFSLHSTALCLVFLNAKTHSVWICPIRKFTAKKKKKKQVIQITQFFFLHCSLAVSLQTWLLLPFTLTINSIFMLISVLCFWTFLSFYLLKPLFCALSGKNVQTRCLEGEICSIYMQDRLKLWRIFQL